MGGPVLFKIGISTSTPFPGRAGYAIKCSVPIEQGKGQGQMAVFKKLAFLPCTVEIGLSLAHLWISLACRANISSTGPAAGVAHHGEPLRTSPGKFLFLNKTWPPWIFTSVLVSRT